MKFHKLPLPRPSTFPRDQSPPTPVGAPRAAGRGLVDHHEWGPVFFPRAGTFDRNQDVLK